MMRGATSRSLLAVSLLAGLLAIAWLAGQRGVADVLAQEPRFEMQRWHAGDPFPAPARLGAMQAVLIDARNLDPRNPRLMEELAHFLAARVRGRYSHEPGVREVRRQSLALLRQSITQRPTFADAWIELAQVKFRLDQVDSEFSQALRQGMRRAPWEATVQLRAIELGLANWEALADPLREDLKQSIRAQAGWQLVKQKPALLALLKRYGRGDLLQLLE